MVININKIYQLWLSWLNFSLTSNDKNRFLMTDEYKSLKKNTVCFNEPTWTKKEKVVGK